MVDSFKQTSPGLQTLFHNAVPREFQTLERTASLAYYDLVGAVANAHHCVNCFHVQQVPGLPMLYDYPHVRGGPGWRLNLRSVLWALDQYDGAARHLKGDVYQFGVWKGWSMMFLRHAYGDQRLLGFDSFQGLPEEDDSVETLEAWKPGVFGDTGAAVREELLSKFDQGMLKGKGGVEFITGFYNTSLTSALKTELHLQPALYIDVDVDLYLSSYQVLDYVFREGIARVGTMIGYDDWWVIPCHENSSDVFRTGEGRAHYEITRKYNVVFKCVLGSCAYPRGGPFRRCSIHNTWAPVFIIAAIGEGAGAGDHGFVMSRWQSDIWRQRSSECQNVLKAASTNQEDFD